MPETRSVVNTRSKYFLHFIKHTGNNQTGKLIYSLVGFHSLVVYRCALANYSKANFQGNYYYFIVLLKTERVVKA